ncbi:hypothetical protein GCM10010197_46130 [Nocardioides luteus]|uniref:Uncharacterized protein n=1 Tax=Nocardioides luteus TaxID=1844 RepID=A0ABQ5SZX3_9ACTN|nr:hypothetical protein GCM10010197_46130 [Nocardioides luteus]GLJ69747.1 hypothetical protein GCM10017579_37830 [Nocardioides luteus]
MDEVKWLSNDEQVAWRAWLAVNAQLTARMNRDLQAKNGLSLADYDVLVNSDRRPGPLAANVRARRQAPVGEEPALASGDADGRSRARRAP